MKKTPSVTAIDGDAVELLTQTLLSGSSQKKFSLYFHIPFCNKKCDYCHFYVIPNQERYHQVYRKALQKEWSLRSSWLPTSENLVSVYFGGGTPALLGPSAIEEILSWISPPSTCEITLEANPENVTCSLMREFKKSGINRISLGVQTFDNSLLNIISRNHSGKASTHAVEMTAEAGIDNISIDLMYDLPNQTLENWEMTLQKALALPIKHLSLYNLTIEPHTVFFKKRESLRLPEQEMSLKMLQTAIKMLKHKGFDRYELSAFAKDNKRSQHNIGYWTGRPFLGFGPSACSYWEGSRFRNVSNLNKYAKALESGKEWVDFKETLSPKESLKEALAVGLRLLEGVPLFPYPLEIQLELKKLEASGLLKQENDRIKLTEKGLLFHDTVAEEIMDF